MYVLIRLLWPPDLRSDGCHSSEKTFAPVNLDRLQHWINTERLVSSPERPITARELLRSGCVHNAKDGVKLLGDVR